MSAAPVLKEHLRQLEEKLLQPNVRRSEPALKGLLADEFVEFASDGVTYNKAEVISALQREDSYTRALTDFHLVPLTENFALATYRASRRNVTSGDTVESLRSSVWVHRNGRWQLVFHQGTNVVP